jgi:hypothetical protein
MKVSILIPWRTDHGQRERIWNYMHPLWEATPFEICVGEDDDNGHPFNCSRATNRAAKKATGDVYVKLGADHLPDVDAIKQAVERTTDWPLWSFVFSGVFYYGKADTNRILAGSNPKSFKPENSDYSCQGIVAMRSGVWDSLGGMDERYEGWGYEDTDFLRRLSGGRERLLRHPSNLPWAYDLWHSGEHRDMSTNNPNRKLYEKG